MSFDHAYYQTELQNHLTNRLGWSAYIAEQVSVIASDVIRLTHGGERHYIQSRNTDRPGIRKDHANGMTISAISKRYGLSAKTVREILK